MANAQNPKIIVPFTVSVGFHEALRDVVMRDRESVEHAFDKATGSDSAKYVPAIEDMMKNPLYVMNLRERVAKVVVDTLFFDVTDDMVMSQEEIESVFAQELKRAMW